MEQQQTMEFSQQERLHELRYKVLSRAFKEKQSFLKQMEEYEKRSFMERLGVRAPRDPHPGFNSDQLLKASIREAGYMLENLNTDRVADDGHRFGSTGILKAVKGKDGKDDSLVMRLYLDDKSRGQLEVHDIPLDVPDKPVEVSLSELRDNVRSSKVLTEPQLFDDALSKVEKYLGTPLVKEGGLGLNGADANTFTRERDNGFAVEGGDFRKADNSIEDKAQAGRVFNQPYSEALVAECVEQNTREAGRRCREEMSSSFEANNAPAVFEAGKMSEVYAFNKLHELETRGINLDESYQEQYQRARLNDVYVARNNSVTAQEIYEDARRPIVKALAADMGMSVAGSRQAEIVQGEEYVAKEPKFGLAELKKLSIQQSRRDPETGKARDKEFLDNLVGNLLDAGYSKDVIKDYVGHEVRERESSYVPSYEIIEQRKADAYVTMITEKVETAFGKGVRDSTKVEIKTPEGMLEDRFTMVSDLNKAKEFVSENSRGEARERDGVSLGGLMFSKGVDFSFKAASLASGFSESLIASGFFQRLADQYVANKREGMDDGLSLSVPARILRNDIINGVDYLIANGEVEKAGRMLYEAGVRYDVPGQPTGEAVGRAAARMYGNGDSSHVNATEDFRKTWKQPLSEASRTFAQQPKPKVKMRRGL